MDTNIRKMEKSDLNAVVKIIHRHDPDDGKCARRYFSQYFSSPKRVKSPDEEHYVIIEAETGKILGVSGHALDECETQGIYWLGWTYVDQKFRRCGLGRKLLGHVFKQIRGTRKVYLDTSSDDKYADAREFYEHFGFQMEGRLKDYYGVKEDRLYYAYNCKKLRAQ